MINEWKPPPEKEDSRWAQAHKGGLTRSVLLDALSHKDEQLQTVSKVMESWEGEGVIGDRLLLSDLHAYVTKLKREKSPLTGPPHACKKTAPPLRYIFAAIPAARLLKDRLPEIKRLLYDAFEFNPPPPLTKRELVQQQDQEREQLEDKIAALQVARGIGRYWHHSCPVAFTFCDLSRCTFPLHPSSTVWYSMVKYSMVQSTYFSPPAGPPIQGSTARTTYPVGGVLILLQDCALSGGADS